MHILFKRLLNNAVGVSESVIIVVIDIRDFSAFSESVESPQCAMFIKKVYMKLIDEYFPFASFYKSTGDGLLLIFHWDERDLIKVARKVIASCINCHSEFNSICKGDPTIYFTVPERIGIGVAMGVACRLRSGDKTIDYSGSLLTLAFRLNDLARPSGIVIAEDFCMSSLYQKQQNLFIKGDGIYMPVIAERKPTNIYFTKKFTSIPDRYKHPIGNWCHQSHYDKFGEIFRRKMSWRCDLSSIPLDPDNIKVVWQHPKIENGKSRLNVKLGNYFYGFKYEMDRGIPVVFIDTPMLCEQLREDEILEDTEVEIIISYIEQ